MTIRTVALIGVCVLVPVIGVMRERSHAQDLDQPPLERVTTQSNAAQIIMAIGILVGTLTTFYTAWASNRVKRSVEKVEKETTGITAEQLVQGRIQLDHDKRLSVIQASVDEATVEKIRASVIEHFDMQLAPVREAIVRNKASADETKDDLRESEGRAR